MDRWTSGKKQKEMVEPSITSGAQSTRVTYFTGEARFADPSKWTAWQKVPQRTRRCDGRPSIAQPAAFVSMSPVGNESVNIASDPGDHLRIPNTVGYTPNRRVQC